MDWLAPNALVHYGDSTERYLVVCVVMTGAGPAAWIQSTVSGFFISIQPDEIGDLTPA